LRASSLNIVGLSPAWLVRICG